VTASAPQKGLYEGHGAASSPGVGTSLSSRELRALVPRYEPCIETVIRKEESLARSWGGTRLSNYHFNHVTRRKNGRLVRMGKHGWEHYFFYSKTVGPLRK